MPKDTAHSGLPPRTDFAPATPGDGFMTLGEATNTAMAGLIGHMDAWQVRRAKIWAVAAEVRSALAATLQGDFTDEQITGAAQVIVDFPEAWRAYRPNEGTPPALSAYKEALDEIEEPALTVKRLARRAGWRFDATAKHLDAAKEALGRFDWPSWTPEQAKAAFDAAMACAAREMAAGAELREAAEAFGKIAAVA